MVALQSGTLLDDAKPRAPSHSGGGCQALQRDELRSAQVEDEPVKFIWFCKEDAFCTDLKRGGTVFHS